MYRKILAAVDGSFNSELAAHHAVAIAASSNSELVAFSVDTGELNPERLNFSIERIARHAEKYGVKASGVVRKGEAVKTILAAVYAEHFDLLVTATRSSDYRLFVRSVAQKLMQKAPCSVIAAKPAGIAMKGKSMLLPIDRRRYAMDERIMLTAGLAKFYHFNVEILHVVERPRWYDLPWDILYKLRSYGEETMLPIAKVLKEQGIDADVHAVVAERRIDAILRETAIGRHSMVLMGASRTGILKQVIAGNPIEQMLSRSLCDVLLWRPKR